jgi:hypothetical protein
MNTRVGFPIAKLLKEKGFNKGNCKEYFTDGTLSISNEPKEVFMEAVKHNKVISCLAPTIADVVMWLYEKHGIWILVGHSGVKEVYMMVTNLNGDVKWNNKGFDSPTEAYESAFEYALNNLI